jgi:hypothetical protein
VEPETTHHLVRFALASGLIVALAGCTSTSHQAVVPILPPSSAVSSSPPVSISHGPPPDAAYTLGLLDQAGATKSFAARYELVSGGQPPVTVDVASTPTAYSIKITGAGSTSLFLVNAKGSYSCEIMAKTSCYLVAKPGQAVPAALDPTLEKVFRGYLHELAENSNDYHLGSGGPGTPASSGVPAGACFTAERKGAATARTVSKGTYCWSSDGLLTKYVSRTGTLTLVSTGPAPDPASIVPPTT